MAQKRIETFESPDGSGHYWQVAVSGRWTDEAGNPAIMIRSANDADEHALEYWRPVLHYNFISKVEAIAKTLQPLEGDEQMDDVQDENEEGVEADVR